MPFLPIQALLLLSLPQQPSRSGHTTTNTTFEAVESFIVSLIKERSVEANILGHNSDIDPVAVAFLMPGRSSSANLSEADGLASYDQAMKRHHLLSDEELSQMLNSVDSTCKDVLPAKDEQVTYVRSWALQVQELARLVDAWIEVGIAIPEAWSWLVDAFVLDNPTKIIHVRYVGSTRGKTAYTRFVEDLPTARQAGILSEFRATLLDIAPRAYEAARTFEVRNARLPSSGPPATRDLREQLLIAFFGRANLLNVQAGSFDASKAGPEPADVDFLKTRNTGFFGKFAKCSQPVPRAMVEALREWQAHIAELVVGKPQSTRSALSQDKSGVL
ncbi:BQ2448_7752 [Microbotryum intermedium]|uniref:BQ2448_7752 protein n=1 Tax=Microbotryum intermedium TaxID=269621 RepID=A0A238FRY9_9BASI|nr:BQ2448_7752 [Microbotryum intermedium]